MAWNDKFPPLNLWNYPMNFEHEVQKRVIYDAQDAKLKAVTKQEWLNQQIDLRQLEQARGQLNTNVSIANSVQEGGNHYKTKAIQPWDYIASNGLGYLEGNIVKYVSRYQDKNGMEDLKKARHYLDKLIEVTSARK